MVGLLRVTQLPLSLLLLRQGLWYRGDSGRWKLLLLTFSVISDCLQGPAVILVHVIIIQSLLRYEWGTACGVIESAHCVLCRCLQVILAGEGHLGRCLAARRDMAEVGHASEANDFFGLAMLKIRLVVADRQSDVILGWHLLILDLALRLYLLCIPLRHPLREGKLGSGLHLPCA